MKDVLDQVRQIRELRSEIERFAARYAARRIADGDVNAAPLRHAFRLLMEACVQQDRAAIAETDQAFHLVILDLAQVPGLHEAWLAVHQREQGFWQSSLRNDWPNLLDLAAIHRPLLEQIAAGDEKGAEDAVMLHLELIWYQRAGATTPPGDPVQMACAYMRLHLDEPLTLRYVAEHISRISVSHLVRLFRQQLGTTFCGYLRDLRLTRARGLLAYGDAPIQDLAATVGYRDPSRFAAHFKRRYGMTPSAWRQSAR